MAGKRSAGGVGERRAGSAASLIHRELRGEILSLARAPGTALNEHEIARRYGVSRTPAREAVLRLADEGLVDIFPQSGTFVSAIPIDELPEAIALRRALEGAVAREAARRAGPDDAALLEGVVAQGRAAAADNDPERFHAADERFHECLALIAALPRFWCVVLQNKLQVDRFRRSTLPVPGRMEAVLAEHAAIVRAVSGRDPAAAAAAMDRHLDALLRSVELRRAGRPPPAAVSPDRTA